MEIIINTPRLDSLKSIFGSIKAKGGLTTVFAIKHDPIEQ